MSRQSDTTFALSHRVDFGEALTPPEGYRLEAALGTTFSMDFLTALTVPVSLALRSGVQRDELLASPLAALAAMRRLEDRVAICVEAGNIHAPGGKRTPLVTLLEGMVTEIAPPKGASFHPKLWLLRFAPEAGGPMRQRLIIMSRNLTRDRSRDVALRLEGEEQDKRQQVNAPLVGLVDWLGFRRTKPLKGLRDGLDHVKWENIPGFARPLFHAHYPETRALWRPGAGRMAVISPFCDDGGLAMLEPGRICALVACDDWLAGLSTRPVRCLTLGDHGLPEPDPEAVATPEDRAGLHAKLFIVEEGDQTRITLGSGNATAAGLGANGPRNVEIFVTLRGETATVGGIGGDGNPGILGEEGLGPLMQDWTPRELQSEEKAARDFDRAVRDARHAIFAARPELTFAPVEERLTVSLAMTLPPLPGIFSVSARLVTQTDPVQISGEGPWSLTSVSLANATTFVQFDLSGPDGATAAFVTKIDAEGLPAGDARLEALLSDMVKTPEQLLAFVAAMLERQPDIDGMMRATADGAASGQSRAPAPPVLETLLAAYLSEDGAARIKDLDRVVGLMKLDEKEETMAAFLRLWAEFKAAIGPKRRGRKVA
ncbi:phospholipase D family protein [Paracoccus sp. DMF-8]|uniref:phospholipase D family protein n=1 Tax=Paracoccus sp. DMF-8 TaxID=3019445 RepID=UPI0023E42E2F|nr:phospholipase D family protein [Paracoccus sp. DMF-8]MDF3608385.1 phospholipase D family protein [Paracoccus sp. DMF-8]